MFHVIKYFLPERWNCENYKRHILQTHKNYYITIFIESLTIVKYYTSNKLNYYLSPEILEI